MATNRAAAATLLLCLVMSLAVSAQAQLRYRYYEQWNQCPGAESIIAASVRRAYNQDNSIIAGLIRLHFHDCFVRGCDGSVLLDGDNSEKVGPPNANSLRGFEVIDDAKAKLEARCPGKVSCADVLAYAARDSVLLGGGYIPAGHWVGGRKDGSISLALETLTNLPAPFSNMTQLIQSFQAKGLSQTEMITLSGSHTVGRAHCAAILARLYNFQGTGKADPSINPSYAALLRTLCPINSPGAFVNMEMRTPTIVDNLYASDVLSGRGLFDSDNALQTTVQGRNTLKALRLSNGVFNGAFGWALVKMSKIEVKVGNQGNIRFRCNETAGV